MGDTLFGERLGAAPILLATLLGVDGEVTQTPLLNFEDGITLADHLPTFGIIKYASGVFLAATARFKADTTFLTPNTGTAQELGSLNAATDIKLFVFGNATAIPNSGSLSLLHNADAAPCTFDVYVYGIPRP